MGSKGVPVEIAPAKHRRAYTLLVTRLRGRTALFSGFVLLVLVAVGVLWWGTGRIVPGNSPAGTLPWEVTQRPEGIPTGTVTRVIDGDTLDVQYKDGTTRRIRLLGIDTPEIASTVTRAECFGKNASDYTRQLLIGRTVGLDGDPSQDDVDRFNRQLRYVWLDDRMVNYLLVREGYAREYTFRVPYRYQALFREAQRQALAARAGMWQACPAR